MPARTACGGPTGERSQAARAEGRGDPTSLPAARPEGPSAPRLRPRAEVSAQGPGGGWGSPGIPGSRGQDDLPVRGPGRWARVWGRRPHRGATDSARGPCLVGLVGAAGPSLPGLASAARGPGRGRGGRALTWLQLAGLQSCRLRLRSAVPAVASGSRDCRLQNGAAEGRAGGGGRAGRTPPLRCGSLERVRSAGGYGREACGSGCQNSLRSRSRARRTRGAQASCWGWT